MVSSATANRGQQRAVRLLIQHNVPLESRSVYGVTALGTAVWSVINTAVAHVQYFRHAVGLTTYGKDSRILRNAEVLERRTSGPPPDIRIDDQFKFGHARKLHLIVLHLTDRVRWTEIPLLSHNFFH